MRLAHRSRQYSTATLAATDIPVLTCVETTEPDHQRGEMVAPGQCNVAATVALAAPGRMGAMAP